jgi:cation diffusion facilitator family transporter
MQTDYEFKLDHDNRPFEHGHDYSHGHEQESEWRVLLVALLTAAMMVVEIAAGFWWNSMALLADGWHMSTHAAALGIGYFGYRYARLHARDQAYSFGTGKVHALASYTSAAMLSIVALWVFADSFWTLWQPKEIQFNQSLVVAFIGLAVNLLSVMLLHVGGGHDHGHSHSHGHSHAHDMNRNAAYAHVIVDSMTSVFAIVALLAGKYMGWIWLDPVVGVVGAVIIAQWSWQLVRQAMPMLLDRIPEEGLVQKLRDALQQDGDTQIADLHVWQVAPGRKAAIISVVNHKGQGVDDYRARLKDFGFDHLSIEVNRCENC